jgi:hypothetical protein
MIKGFWVGDLKIDTVETPGLPSAYIRGLFMSGIAQITTILWSALTLTSALSVPPQCACELLH